MPLADYIRLHGDRIEVVSETGEIVDSLTGEEARADAHDLLEAAAELDLLTHLTGINAPETNENRGGEKRSGGTYGGGEKKRGSFAKLQALEKAPG